MWGKPVPRKVATSGEAAPLAPSDTTGRFMEGILAHLALVRNMWFYPVCGTTPNTHQKEGG